MKLNFKNRPLTRALVLFFLIILAVRLIGLTSFPDLIFPKINLFFSKMLYTVSSRFTFSVGDSLYMVLIVFGFGLMLRALFRLADRDFFGFRKTLAVIINWVSLLYLVLYLFWGFNYYKTPIKESYDIESVNLTELKKLAEYYYLCTAELRRTANQNERGVFESEIGDLELSAEIKKSVQKLGRMTELKFDGYVQPNLKRSEFSSIASYIGISGYYNPFTNESQYNSIYPDSRKLFAKLHETAHQFGFASESEANFVGFLIGLESSHTDLLYAVNFRAMRSLLNRILLYDPEYVKDFVENRYTAGMKADRDYEIEIDLAYNNASEDAFALMNDGFLRLNNQEGIESYGRFVELLVGFHRKYGILK